MLQWKESGRRRSYPNRELSHKESQSGQPAQFRKKGTSPDTSRPFNKENNNNQYSHVVLPPISMMHLHSLEISRLLKGRTRTATFTDDMFKSASNTHTYSQTQARCYAPVAPNLTRFTDCRLLCVTAQYKQQSANRPAFIGSTSNLIHLQHKH